MKIGELAKKSETPIETIRYYEREGLLPEASRSEANYRIYEQSHLERLIFIRQCRRLDMSLSEIQALLKIESTTKNCTEIHALLDEHIRHVSQRIKELQSLEKALKNLCKKCTGEENENECGIFSALSTASIKTEKNDYEKTHVKKHIHSKN